MKRYSVIVIMILALAYSSCKKASGPADKNSVQPNNNLDTLVNVSADINGVNWSTVSAYGYSIKSATDSGKYDLLITASKTIHDTGFSLSFLISSYSGPGTYNIDPPAYTATYYKGSERHFATSGTITIDSDTIYGVIGSFSFVADTITVANGKLNVAKP